MRHKVSNMIKRAIDIGFRIFTLKNEMVFFISFNGQYNDNPKSISEKLYEMHPEYQFIWVISDRCHEAGLIPPYIKQIKPESIEYYYYKNRAKVLIDNGVGVSVWNSHFFLEKVIKKKGQLNISTWHGTPMKKIGSDSKNSNIPKAGKFITSSNLILAGCSYTEECLKSAWYNKIPILKIGTPRNDKLFSESSKKAEIRDRLKLPKNSNLLLFCPTYRDNPEDSGLVQLKLMDIDHLLQKLKNRFGGEWKFVYRVHNLVLDLFEKSETRNNNIINGNMFDDMQEYLLACDAILTDYSGALFDVALTNKPCFLYAHDRVHYTNNERGLYVETDFLPFDFADTFSELVNNIDRFDYHIDKERRKEFLARIGNVEDGNASKRVVEIIEKHISDK